MVYVIRETHEAPADVARELLLAGGCNRFGQANYRDAEGKLVREVVEVRFEPKYVPHDRWHIERWLPPENYGSPERWRAETIEIENGRSVPALGPYPSRGDYEHCFTLEGPRGEFVQLTPSVARYIARAIEVSRALHHVKRREALEERARREEREYDAHVDAVLA